MKPSVFRRILFQALVFLIPTQLSLHLWPEWAHVFGIRVDYLSPTIYLTDLILVVLLGSWLLDKKPNLPKFTWIIGPLILISINIFVAQRPQVSFLKWLKIFELFLLALYVAKEKNFRFKNWLAKPLMFSVIFFSLIACFQFFYQRTLGGPFYFLGERTFSAVTPGIALFSFFGKQLLRSYSTFPHPNALAGFMLVSLILLFGVEPKNRRDIIAKKIAVVLAVVSVLVSISHSAWLTAFIVSIFYFLIYKYPQLRKLVIFVPLILIISSILLLPLSRKFLTSKTGYPEEVEKRLVLTESAGRIIAAYPLFGVGLGNFVVRLPEFSVRPAVSWWLQPVHNIFLLIFTETGVLGLLAFSYLVFKVLKKLLEVGSWKLIIPLLIVLLTGAVDHYWVTLQQNQLLFSLLLGISFRKL